jgi:hypothetical protein
LDTTDSGVPAGAARDVVVHYEHVKARSKFAGYRVVDATFFGDGLIEYWQHHRFQLTLGWLPVSLSAGERAFTGATDIQNLWDEMMPSVEDSDPTMAFTPTLSDYRPGEDDESPIWQPGRLSEKLLTNPAAAFVIQAWRPTLGFFNNQAFRVGVDSDEDGTPAGTSKVQTLWQIPEKWIRVGVHPQTNGYLAWAVTNPKKPVTYSGPNMAPRAGVWENQNFLTKELDKLTGNASISPATTDDWRRWSMSFEFGGGTGVKTQWVELDIGYRIELIPYFEQTVIGQTADGQNDSPVIAL